MNSRSIGVLRFAFVAFASVFISGMAQPNPTWHYGQRNQPTPTTPKTPPASAVAHDPLSVSESAKRNFQQLFGKGKGNYDSFAYYVRSLYAADRLSKVALETEVESISEKLQDFLRPARKDGISESMILNFLSSKELGFSKELLASLKQHWTPTVIPAGKRSDSHILGIAKLFEDEKQREEVTNELTQMLKFTGNHPENHTVAKIETHLRNLHKNGLDYNLAVAILFSEEAKTLLADNRQYERDAITTNIQKAQEKITNEDLQKALIAQWEDVSPTLTHYLQTRGADLVKSLRKLQDLHPDTKAFHQELETIFKTLTKHGIPADTMEDFLTESPALRFSPAKGAAMGSDIDKLLFKSAHAWANKNEWETDTKRDDLATFIHNHKSDSAFYVITNTLRGLLSQRDEEGDLDTDSFDEAFKKVIDSKLLSPTLIQRLLTEVPGFNITTPGVTAKKQGYAPELDRLQTLIRYEDLASKLGSGKLHAEKFETNAAARYGLLSVLEEVKGEGEYWKHVKIGKWIQEHSKNPYEAIKAITGRNSSVFENARFRDDLRKTLHGLQRDHVAEKLTEHAKLKQNPQMKKDFDSYVDLIWKMHGEDPEIDLNDLTNAKEKDLLVRNAKLLLAAKAGPMLTYLLNNHFFDPTRTAEINRAMNGNLVQILPSPKDIQVGPPVKDLQPQPVNPDDAAEQFGNDAQKTIQKLTPQLPVDPTKQTPLNPTLPSDPNKGPINPKDHEKSKTPSLNPYGAPPDPSKQPAPNQASVVTPTRMGLLKDISSGTLRPGGAQGWKKLLQDAPTIIGDLHNDKQTESIKSAALPHVTGWRPEKLRMRLDDSSINAVKLGKWMANLDRWQHLNYFEILLRRGYNNLESGEKKFFQALVPIIATEYARIIQTAKAERRGQVSTASDNRGEFVPTFAPGDKDALFHKDARRLMIAAYWNAKSLKEANESSDEANYHRGTMSITSNAVMGGTAVFGVAAGYTNNYRSDIVKAWQDVVTSKEPGQLGNITAHVKRAQFGGMLTVSPKAWEAAKSANGVSVADWVWSGKFGKTPAQDFWTNQSTEILGGFLQDHRVGLSEKKVMVWRPQSAVAAHERFGLNALRIHVASSVGKQPNGDFMIDSNAIDRMLVALNGIPNPHSTLKGVARYVPTTEKGLTEDVVDLEVVTGADGQPTLRLLGQTSPPPQAVKLSEAHQKTLAQLFGDSNRCGACHTPEYLKKTSFIKSGPQIQKVVDGTAPLASFGKDEMKKQLAALARHEADAVKAWLRSVVSPHVGPVAAKETPASVQNAAAIQKGFADLKMLFDSKAIETEVQAKAALEKLKKGAYKVSCYSKEEDQAKKGAFEYFQSEGGLYFVTRTEKEGTQTKMFLGENDSLDPNQMKINHAQFLSRVNQDKMDNKVEGDFSGLDLSSPSNWYKNKGITFTNHKNKDVLRPIGNGRWIMHNEPFMDEKWDNSGKLLWSWQIEEFCEFNTTQDILTGASVGPTPTPNPTIVIDKEKITTVANAISDMGLKMQRDITKHGGNSVTSPITVAGLLGSVLQGANGQAADEIASVLHLTDKGISGADLKQIFAQGYREIRKELGDGIQLRNAVYTDIPDAKLTEQFKTSLKTYFDADIHPVDFSKDAVQKINADVEEATRLKGAKEGLIKNLLSQAKGPMVVTATSVFDQNWEKSFQKATPQEFYYTGPDGYDRKKQVAMMKRSKGTLPVYKNNEFMVVAIPYAGGKLSMYAIVPVDRDGESGLKALERVQGQFNQATFNQVRAQMTNQLVEIQIPKMKFDTRVDITGLLKSQMPTAFNGGGLMGISNDPRLGVSQVVSSTVLDVNELNTQGASGSASNIVVLGNTPRPFEFLVNRPALFIIAPSPSAERAPILYSGTIVDPTQR